MKYLLDTNLCIQLIRHKPAQTLQRITACAVGELGLSTITVAELDLGVEKSKQPEQNRAALEQFLLPFVIADFDYEAARAYGPLRAQLERAGTPIGPLALLIAAHAVSLRAVLVTNNVKEFARVPGLKVEDWTRV